MLIFLMNNSKIDFVNNCKYNPNLDKLELVFDYFLKNNILSGSIELALIKSAQMKKLNNTQRGINKITDVLSFAYSDGDEKNKTNENKNNKKNNILDDFDNMPGSVVICFKKVKQMAKHHNHSLDDEITLLFIHGLLHIANYDHESDNGQQRAMEEKIIKHFKLPSSLIVRTIN